LKKNRFLPADLLLLLQLERDLQSERVHAESYGVFHRKLESLISWGAEKEGILYKKIRGGTKLQQWSVGFFINWTTNTAKNQ